MGSALDASLSLQLGPGPLAAAPPPESAASLDKAASITCVHCQQAVSPAELRLAIQCGRPACGRYAHALCAVEHKYAGVLEAPGLDGQYLCRLCGTKSDLLPYWKERLSAAATGEGLALGQHLGLAARLLHKTRRPEVEPVQAQVEYAVAQLVAGQDADIIAKLLRQLAAEADRVAPGRPSENPGPVATSTASPPWPRSDAGVPALALAGSGSKVERDFLVGLRTASAGLDRGRPTDGVLQGSQAALSLGRLEGGHAWGLARTTKDGLLAGEHPSSEVQLAAAEQLAHLTRTLQVAVDDAQSEALRLKAQAEADLRRAHAAREEATAAEVAARRALEEAAAQEALARASIAAAQRAQDKAQQLSARGEAQLEALKQELHAQRGLCAPPEPAVLPFSHPGKGASAGTGSGSRYGDSLESSLRSQLKMAQLLDQVRAADRQRAEERRRADQMRFQKVPSLPVGAGDVASKGEDAAERGGGLLAALRAEPSGSANGERAASDTFLMLSSGGGGTPLKRGRPSDASEEAGALMGPGPGPKAGRSSLGAGRSAAEEGPGAKEHERGSAILAQARDFLTEMDGEVLGSGREVSGGGDAALAAERSIKDAELVMRAELAVLQNLVPHLARQFGERKFRVLVIVALARQWDGTWRMCLTRRKGKGFRLQLPMCGLEAGLDLLGEERPDTLPLARKLARDALGETAGSVLLASPAGYAEPVRYTEEQKDGSLTIALIHPLLASAAEVPFAHPGTSYHHGETYVSWCRADALVPVVRDVPQKFSATFPRVLKCLELLMGTPIEGWPLPQLLKLGVQAPDVLG